MPDLIHVDVSEHQAETFDNTYTHQFGMFRAASEWDRPDSKAPANLAWCVKARAAGGLVNFGVYVIPGNVPNDAVMGRLDALGVPDDCVIMMDVESWGGLITGDHSLQFNVLADTLRRRQSGRPDLVWGYLNPNVDLNLWPQRPVWLGFIQPAYGKPDPPDPKGLNRVGWQYCNAVLNGTTYPSSSPPFGRCDHNIMYINYPKPGADVTPDEHDALMRIDKACSLDQTHPGLPSLGAVYQTVRADTNDLSHNYTNASIAQKLAAIQLQLTTLADAVAALQPPGAGTYTMTGELTPKPPA